MNYFLRIALLVTSIFFAQHPETKKISTKKIQHKVVLEDQYKWLEETQTEAVNSWVDLQNQYTEKHLEEVQNKHSFLFKIKEYDALSTNGLPTKKGKYFYSLYRKDKALPASLFFRKELNDDPIEVFNPTKITKNKNCFIAGYYPSKNNKYIAVTLSNSGSDIKQLRFSLIDNQSVIIDSINNVKFSNVVWDYDKGIYYKKNTNKIRTEKDSTFQIFYHPIGSKQEDDQLIYDATKTNGRINFFKSEDKLILEESNRNGVSYRYIKLGQEFNENNVINIIENDTTNFKFHHFSENKFYFSSPEFDWGEIRFFYINNKQEEKVIVPQIYNHLLLDAIFFDEYIVCKYKTVGKNYISIYDYEGQFIRKFDAPTGFDFDIKFYDDDKTDLYASFYSYTVSYQNFKLNIKTGAINNFFNDYVRPKPTIFPLDYFETKVFTFTSRDGKEVPITIIHKKGLPLDGNNPTLLEAYGGYGTVSGPNFNSGLLCFLDKGGVYAYAEIRGGGEKGLKWHRDGKGLKKLNSFNDFIDAAEFLIKEKYTSPQKIAITGASNGGLLIGAVITMRPDLFKVAIPKVGVFDMVNFDSFTAGTYWKSEYGNVALEQDFKNILTYSPLHNVKPDVNYPTTLVITGENDDRVVPSHSYKFTAKLQNNKGQINPIYLRTLSNAGHSGKAIYKDNVQEKAFFYGFLLYHLNN